MAKTILIPTDFKVASLTTLKWALDRNLYEQVDALLIYPRYLDAGITESLFYSPDKIISENLTPEFTEAIEILTNRYTGVLNKVQFEILAFDTHTYVNGFIKSNGVDEIYLPATFLSDNKKNLFDPIPVFNKSDIPVFQTNVKPTTGLNERQHLIALFS